MPQKSVYTFDSESRIHLYNWLEQSYSQSITMFGLKVWTSYRLGYRTSVTDCIWHINNVSIILQSVLFIIGREAEGRLNHQYFW